MPTGVFTAFKKDKTEYYRASVTFLGKHISLGSFDQADAAANAYREALEVLYRSDLHYIDENLLTTTYSDRPMHLSFEKYILLINFRDHRIYIKTPIYLCQKYFLYFLAESMVLRFDTDDLFYYSNHKIMARGGYYFVNDFGMQTGILSRYGIRAHAVKGRDYVFRNGDENDYRYENVLVINRYNGVSQIRRNGRIYYRAVLHINGNYVIGDYTAETEAAIAYNKAADLIQPFNGVAYARNYIENISSIEYASVYNALKLSGKFRMLIRRLQEQTAGKPEGCPQAPVTGNP